MACARIRHVRVTLRHIGLHLRLTSTLSELIEKAVRLKLDLFQCFLVLQSSGRLIVPTNEDAQHFLTLRRQYFKDVILHGSYWINLASIYNTKHYSMDREIALAKKLAFNYIVLHAGSAKGGRNKYDGIDAVVRVLNTACVKDPDIHFVLENAAFGNLSVGGDIEDFALILKKLDRPEKLLFCIDTAHAHSYGYDVHSEAGQEQFIQLLATAIGIERIALLHLNDTKQIMGSKRDQHDILGQGLLGVEALRRFAMHPNLAHIPLLLELPDVPEEKETEILAIVRSWHEKL